MKYLPLIALLLATPAAAKDITITLTDQEQKAFLTLLDGALKASGLANFEAVAKFVLKFQEAVKAANPPPAPPADKKPE